MTEQAPPNIRVFIVDDHELVRRGLRDFIAEADGVEIVGEAATAGEAVAMISASLVDVAILDVRLPDGDGIQVCREVRSQHPEVACLILTSFSDEGAVLDAIMAGASGYLLKETRGSEIVDAILRVASGASLLDASVTQQVMDGVRNNGQSRSELTPQEERILELIGKGHSNREIAQQLFLAEQTVKNYVSRLLAKLNLKRRTQAAIYAGNRALRKDDKNS